jgi:hypothetical protein
MGLPEDFNLHLKLFCDELEIVRPAWVLALGDFAHNLLRAHVPEIKPILGKMWHFAYAVRYGRIAEWEENTRLALFGATTSLHKGKKTVVVRDDISKINDSGQLSDTMKHYSQRAVMQCLFVRHGGDIATVIAAYADAERNGGVTRNSNRCKLGSEEYAKVLLNDGFRKGWLKRCFKYPDT